FVRGAFVWVTLRFLEPFPAAIFYRRGPSPRRSLASSRPAGMQGLWRSDADAALAACTPGQTPVECQECLTRYRGCQMQGIGEIHAGFGPVHGPGDQFGVLHGDLREPGQGT